jgi:two-component system, chemotaxis family, sensor kinase CheA
VSKKPPPDSPGSGALVPVDDEEILSEFLAETRDHMDEVESLTLAAETTGDRGTVDALFRAFHSTKGSAGFLGLESLQDLSHAIENALDAVRRGERKLESSLVDLLLEGVDLIRRMLEECAPGGVIPSMIPTNPQAEEAAALVARVTAPSMEAKPEPEPESAEVAPVDEDVSEAPSVEKKTAAGKKTPAKKKQEEEPETEKTAPATAIPPPAPKTPRPAKAKAPPAKAGPAAGRAEEILRVKAAKVDGLVDLVGELVIAETLVAGSLLSVGISDHRLDSSLSQLVKTVKSLQDSVLSLRAVPIEGTFRRIQRASRDLEKTTGKSFTLDLQGEDTELDRSVVESLFDPLVHLLRNAVDHGLEDSDTREQNGKSRQGCIRLSAGHRSGDVVIEMSDDGHGIDTDKVLERARERGLVGAEAPSTTAEILDFLFMPGFSTAKSVTDLSGRGVGLDVVRRGVEGLRGRVTVRTEMGVGTTFTLRLPLTLAIIEGMVVGLAGERYVLPLQTIERIVTFQRGDVSTIRGGRAVLKDRGVIHPIVRLQTLFGLVNVPPPEHDGLIILLESHNGIFGLHVDKVLGQQQVVVKGLGSGLTRDEWIAGGAVLEDGRAGLILDVEGLAALTATTGQEWEDAEEVEPEEIPV